MSAADAERKSKAAAQGIFAASAAVNAIPIAGQFASAGLAIAGLFVKLFGGRRQRKREEAALRAQEKRHTVEQRGGNAPSAPAVQGGQQAQTSIVPTTNFQGPPTPSFQGGGGQEPTISPTQQALNNRMF